MNPMGLLGRIPVQTIKDRLYAPFSDKFPPMSEEAFP
jgi:hypothetical protein